MLGIVNSWGGTDFSSQCGVRRLLMHQFQTWIFNRNGLENEIAYAQCTFAEQKLFFKLVVVVFSSALLQEAMALVFHGLYYGSCGFISRSTESKALAPQPSLKCKKLNR